MRPRTYSFRFQRLPEKEILANLPLTSVANFSKEELPESLSEFLRNEKVIDSSGNLIGDYNLVLDKNGRFEVLTRPGTLDGYVW